MLACKDTTFNTEEAKKNAGAVKETRDLSDGAQCGEYTYWRAACRQLKS